MPIVLRYKGYRFFFFSNEGNPREPLHIHVRDGELIAKFWLLPEIRLAENYGFTTAQLGEILEVIEVNHELFARKWNEYFGS
jgi:hypothetical protein